MGKTGTLNLRIMTYKFWTWWGKPTVIEEKVEITEKEFYPKDIPKNVVAQAASEGLIHNGEKWKDWKESLWQELEPYTHYLEVGHGLIIKHTSDKGTSMVFYPGGKIGPDKTII